MSLGRGQFLMHITAEPFEETAEALRRVIPTVVEQCVQRLRCEVAELRGKSRFHLNDALPELLEQLARVMGEGLPAVALLASKARKHAAHREHQELDLDQMLLEYQLLRELLPRGLADSLERDLTVEEAVRLHGALDLAVREAAAVFASQTRGRLQAEAAALAKYLSFLSHDLRGHLNGAMLMIEVLRRDLSAEPRFAENVADLDAMRQSMLDLVSTMDRFLNAERLRQGRVEVSLQTIDLAEFLREQRRAIGRQFRGAEENIQLGLEAEPLKLITDREMLTLVIQNTLSNCVKYSAGKPVSIAVSRRTAGDAADTSYRIEISDQGPGMSPDIQQRLFEPFARGADTGQPGTGLGLFIAKQAADLLSAKLAVLSKPGEGTTFVIDLPAAPGAPNRS